MEEMQESEIPQERQQTQETESAEPVRREGNTIYVGKKNPMAYVLSVVTMFNQGAPEVRLKARGMSISRAVDVNQITRNRFIPTLQNKQISLTTENLTREDGTPSRVSSIEIVMTK